jgi:hypothetical protein
MNPILKVIIQIGIDVGLQFAKKSGPHVEEAKHGVAKILETLYETGEALLKKEITMDAAEAIALAQFDDLQILFDTFLIEELIDAEAVPNMIVGGFKNSFLATLGKLIP